MTTGPRPTPHPIILHVDDNGNPVRLAEASAIYVTSAVIGTLSAINYQGLTVEGAGLPGGSDGQIQYRKNSTQFGGDSGLTYDESNARLGAVEIVVGNLSATTDAVFNNLVTAEEILAVSVSAGSSRITNLSSTTISAVTVCATNYNAALEALSFQNLDNRYLNSSGDSVTGSFYLQNLSSVTISATSYQNLPSALATWNASAIRGIPVTSTAPLQYQSLVYFDGVWQPSSVAGGPGGGTPGGTGFSIQFNNGVFSGVDSVKYNQTFNGIESTQLSSTNLSSVNLRSTNLNSTSLSSISISSTNYFNLPSGEPVWNALKLQGYSISKGTLIQNDILAFTQTGAPGVGYFEKRTLTDYAGAIYPDLQPSIHANLPKTNASAIQGITVTATAPSLNNVLIYNGSVWTPSGAISLGTISATNLGGTNIVGFSAVVSNVSSTGLSSIDLSATNLSAINSRITALSATTLSATTYQGLPSGTATWNANALSGIPISYNNPQPFDILAVGAGTITNVTPALAAAGLSPYIKNAHSAGEVSRFQFKAADGGFSSVPEIYYEPTFKNFIVSNVYQADGGVSNLGYLVTRAGANLAGTTFLQTASATTYIIFGKDTSSAGSPTPTSNNQTITYDSTGQKWKPGYAVYQATGVPDNSIGSNGDIYFRYIP